ncbi:putative cytidylate kinase [Astathelohania contejeani]|uniref:(d)CMP kinase n=1 Tax=Astathelohania contejeani TaxID=164912 RepID=A0ABQ7HY59_9MICR|nr:putative cytidylate kinase [Thelohania contejeani]
MMKYPRVAIDGPAGVGKSTTAEAVAKRLGYARVDSGTLYRAITYILLKNSIKSFDSEITKELISKIDFQVKSNKIIYENQDISMFLRSVEVNNTVAEVAKVSFIREKVRRIQMDIINNTKEGLIVDGRDIGTVILPNADVKIFLTASIESRAKRRYEEMVKQKLNVAYDSILKEISKRDYEDTTREIAPLKMAEDAILVDNSSMSFAEVVMKIISLINEKLKQ